MRSIALLLTLGFLSCPARAAAPEDATRVLSRTAYAQVLGHPDAQGVAGRVAAAVDEAVPRIAPLVGAQDLRPVQAYVYDDRERFRRATGLPRQSTITGIATFPDEVIHIDGTGLLASIEKIVPHEVGHVMIGRALGPAVFALPHWANEGIAEYVAGERAAQVDPVALQAIGRGSAFDLRNLDEAIRAGGERAGGERAGLAYAQSASLVNFLVAERREPVIADLLAALRERGDFESALQQSAGFSLPELESAWRGSLSR
ncbi:MAG: peptidase MA family metallohydrolase, partial [Armatimonadetes bacterium]|nr:peptidase MA family metallohydrolase [Armatimonadota bacterium]